MPMSSLCLRKQVVVSGGFKHFDFQIDIGTVVDKMDFSLGSASKELIQWVQWCRVGQRCKVRQNLMLPKAREDDDTLG